MQPNNATVPNIPKKGRPVPLNQPFPKEMDNAPLVDIAEVVGQTALEKSVVKNDALTTDPQATQAVGDILQKTGALDTELAGVKPAESKPKPKKAESTESSKSEKEKPAGFPKEKAEKAKEKVSQIKDKVLGGKSLKDLVKSPGKLSEAEKKDPKKVTSNKIVKTIIIAGVVMLVIGLLTMFFVKASTGIIIMMIGGIAVIVSVFLPIGAKK